MTRRCLDGGRMDQHAPAARTALTQSFIGYLMGTGTKQYIRHTRLAGFGVRTNPGGKVVFVGEGRVKRSKPVRM